MFTLYRTAETFTLSPTVIGEFATFDAAAEYAKANYQIIHFEADAQNEGCADFYAANGSLYMIEPTARRAH